MVNLGNNELIARCVPLVVQPATISQNSATNSATNSAKVNATNSLRALANTVLERNRLCNHTATDTQSRASVTFVSGYALQQHKPTNKTTTQTNKQNNKQNNNKQNNNTIQH